MIKHAFIILLLTSITIISCKKKDTSPTPTTGSMTQNTNDSYGTLQTLLIHYYDGNVFIGSDSLLTASLFASPITNTIPSQANAGYITFNGITLKNTANHYQDSTHTTNIHQANSVWTVSGSSDVPAFTHTVTPSFPVFTGNSQLPDSISKASGVTINLSGVSNAANYGITVQLISGNNTVVKNMFPNQMTCSFTSADLSSLSPDNNAIIIVVISNGAQQSFGGKSYAFDNVLEHIKYIKLKS